MRCALRSAFLALALTGGSLAVALPATAADVSVGVSPGGIAFGYSDGYWDQGHQWHKWHDQRQAAEFRKENHEHYYAHRHDADRDHGWHENEQYWHHG
jgi:hypothetical protein